MKEFFYICNMKVELLCRYNKTISKDIEEEVNNELNILEITRSEFNRQEEKEKLYAKYKIDAEFDYGPFVLDLKDIKKFNFVDPKHTCIRFENDSYTFKVNYDIFKAIYTVLNDTPIRNLINISSSEEINEIIK